MTGADAREDCLAMADDMLRITRTDNPPGLIIAGEIDESNYSVLVAGLAAQAPNGDVHVDLRGVDFCDIAGLRAIVRLAGPLNENRPARRVILHAVPPRLLRILQILGWDAMPGVAFDERGLPGGRDLRRTCSARRAASGADNVRDA